MVGDARLLILLPLETRQVAPDNTVVLTLKLCNQTLVAPYSTDNRSNKACFTLVQKPPAYKLLCKHNKRKLFPFLAFVALSLV